MASNRGILTILLTVMMLVWPIGASAQESFFKGKTVRIVVGFAAGGGFDTYTRAIARYWGRHIPGNPSIIVENMAGAGSLIAANHVYKAARPDGLTIGNFGGGLFMQQLKGGAGIEFDARKFEFLGVPVQDNRSCAFTKASGITSMERWMAAKTPVKVGATAPGDLVHDGPKILQAALGLPIHLVSGYKGTADIRLGAESGELAGGCWGWDSIKATWSRALESGEAIVVVQMVSKPHPDLPKVPLAISYAKSDDARQLIESGVTIPAITNRPYVVGPGTPKDRVQLLRKAFDATMKDPEFVADAKKSRIDLEPIGGAEVQKMVADMFNLSPALIAKLRDALK
ncbi:MAG TPA: tripartite tricarboxylate transporter substrate-binding protein [Candidatus Limnocylindria bacterium]|nr:tripartite tricarboxylate transporter substrate-binding protein [Candidatus Limnocylindria bacterium]